VEARTKPGREPASERRRQQLLRRLKAEGASPAEALQRIAAFHIDAGLARPDLRVGPRRAELRQGFVRAGEQIFPHPRDVPPLLLVFLRRAMELWQDCRCTDDDLLVALFAMYGVTAIHPFNQGNGRTALDLAQLMLMHRWDLDQPPFKLPAEGHAWLGGLFPALDVNNDGHSAEGFVRQREHLLERLGAATLEELKAVPGLRAAREWLGQALPAHEATAAVSPS